MTTLSLRDRLFRTQPVPTGEQAESHGLKRSLGAFSLTMLGVGGTIGTGIFFTMAEAVPKAGPSVILSFLIAAFTAGLTALCYAELAARIPASGSSYSYVYATLGEFLAYVVAACILLEYG
ncbi:MAG: amino acid permease, partial [Betaproteobacteria bacterium]|nr:amino acid permease [Betaproteobacteria bacterium]